MGDQPDASVAILDGKADQQQEILLNNSAIDNSNDVSLEEKNDNSSSPPPAVSVSAAVTPKQSTSLSCEMCQNYELNLTIMQDNERRLKEELKAAKALSSRYESDLANEREYRRELEKKMLETSEQINDKVKEAKKSTSAVERKLEETQTKHNQTNAALLEQLQVCNLKVQNLEADLEALNAKYLELLGAQRSSAAAMRSEPIDLPSDVDQLQFACLQLREELIEEKAAKQHLEQTLKGEVAMLTAQISEERRARQLAESGLMEQVNSLQTQLGIANSQLSSVGEAIKIKSDYERQVQDLKATINDMEEKITTMRGEITAVSSTANNYKQRCVALQAELDTSEIVQKDFVKLSQDLQIQLEKIRASEQEVRWQFDEDVDNCSGCETSVAKLKPKPHCLHCGKIFCANCVSQTVVSGPNRRPANVCKVCHTLLSKDSKPFFAP